MLPAEKRLKVGNAIALQMHMKAEEAIPCRKVICLLSNDKHNENEGGT